LLLFLFGSISSASQLECLVGKITYPCPDIQQQRDSYGVGFRTYAEIATASVSRVGVKGDTPLRMIRTLYPILEKYFNPAGNVEKVTINQTVPIGAIKGTGSNNETFYQAMRFLPDALFTSIPTPVNPGEISVGLVPAGTQVMSLAFTEDPTEGEILRQLDILSKILDDHGYAYVEGVYGLFLYNIPGNPVEFGWSEIWRFTPLENAQDFFRRTSTEKSQVRGLMKE